MAAPGGAGHLGDLAVADPVPRVVQEAVVPLHRGHAEVGSLHRAVLRDMSPPRTVLTLLPARRVYTGDLVDIYFTVSLLVQKNLADVIMNKGLFVYYVAAMNN